MSLGKGDSSNGSQDEAFRRMRKLVNSLLSRSDCGPFREPVDWRGLELYDYPKIIKNMMDLGTVKRKLERAVYSTARECSQDIRLVWNNCMTYNMEGSDFWLLAKSFSRRFEDRYKKIRAEVDTGQDLAPEVSKADASTPDVSSKSSMGGAENYNRNGNSEKNAPSENSASIDTKVHFSTNIFLLSGMELGHVMSKIEQKCPTALVALGGESVEINVDALDNRILNELDRYVREKVGVRYLAAAGAKGGGEERPNKKRKK